MEKDGLAMQSWMTENDIEKTILPEVNRIWRAAGVTFTLEKVIDGSALSPPDQRQLLDDIVSAHRNHKGKSDPQRIKKLSRLIDFTSESPVSIHIYLVPYLGETSQGHTQRRHRRIFIGQWSDKASKAREKPERVLLTEERPFQQGSLSRTVAHELGHVLGLKHPHKATQTVFGLLMGGKRPGYSLTPQEIEQARRQAAALSKQFSTRTD
ncbi:MAG: hypothetical protein AB7P69_17985 [Candidatus Binatia bacterium]